MRVLIAGVGYRNLSDHSFGVAMTDGLAGRSWPGEVAVEDLSFNPIAVVQRLEDEPPERRFDLGIFVGAAARAGRAPGTLGIYRWDGVLPSDDRIQSAVTEGVTGVISLDNTLLVARYWNALPVTLVVIEVEPLDEACGDAFSPAVAAAFEQGEHLIVALASDPSLAATIPQLPLGGGAPPPVVSSSPRSSSVRLRFA